ncbi:hypothetical protein HYU40_03615 [Candidatus Woesearchaeota archaeon]|nr:hypothetical protein [Candidatus Woesearchaeota archaeon]
MLPDWANIGAEKKIECKSGKDVESALNELGIITAEEFSEEIRGTPASPGKVKGIVTIVPCKKLQRL